MKVGGGLNYVAGPMGAGKTLYAVRIIVDALCSGKYVITNIPLMPGWAERIARHVAPFNVFKRGRIAERLQALYVFEESLEAAMRYRVPGRGEARALFVWDETHNDLNNRNWKDQGRDEILRWATQLRKLGFVGFLISQHTDNTDAALRRICNFVVRLQNQREQVRGIFGIRWTPIPLFLAYWYPAHLGGLAQKKDAVRMERFVLSWHKKLYDTHGLYHGLIELAEDEEDERVIRLPEVGGTVPPRRKAAAGGEPRPGSV